MLVHNQCSENRLLGFPRRIFSFCFQLNKHISRLKLPARTKCTKNFKAKKGKVNNMIKKKGKKSFITFFQCLQKHNSCLTFFSIQFKKLFLIIIQCNVFKPKANSIPYCHNFISHQNFFPFKREVDPKQSTQPDLNNKCKLQFNSFFPKTISSHNPAVWKEVTASVKCPMERICGT